MTTSPDRAGLREPRTKAGRALNKFRTMNDRELTGYIVAIEDEAAALAATGDSGGPGLDVERLQFVQRIHDEAGGSDRWEAVSIDNPARRATGDTMEAALRALAARLREDAP